MDQVTRLGSFTTLWRLHVRYVHRTPPYDAHEPIELRALSEQTALDLLAHWRPDLTVLSIARRPTP